MMVSFSADKSKELCTSSEFFKNKVAIKESNQYAVNPENNQSCAFFSPTDLDSEGVFLIFTQKN